MEKIKIGNVEFKSRAVLAPMAGITDRAYRELCVEFGAAYCVSEMVSSKALSFNSKKSEELMEISDYERPCGIQIFGDDPKCMADAAVHSMENKPDIIDINMGCPVPKIVGNGSGSALMKSPKTALEIAEETVKNANCPVTVKIRAGWDNDSINAVEFAKALEQTGISAIAVHGRTRSQMYSGQADWDIIKQVKKAVSIPVIGNGDVKYPEDCNAMYEQTACDLVMIGRGSYGKPWIFREIKHYLETGQLLPEISLEEKMSVMLRHGRMLCKYKGEKQGMKEMRKNVAWYIKGLPGSARMRGDCGLLNHYSDLETMAEQILLRGE